MNAKKTPFPSFEGARLLVAGDLMLDQYTWGDVERVSPEAPVLVLRAEQEEVRLGGAASVAGLLAGLKIRGIVAGVVGHDPAGRIVARLLSERHEPSAAAVPHDCLAKARGRGACSGCRNGKLKPAPIGAELCRTEGIEDRDILVVDPARPTTVKDYAKGVCTPSFLARLIKQARESEVPVLVDPARGVDFDRYRGATLIKANRQEAELALGCPIRHRRHAFAAGRELCRNWDLQAAMVTLDREGIVLVTADGDCRPFEARVPEVAD